MKKYIKNLVASLLLIVFLVSSYIPVVAYGSSSLSYNQGERDEIATSLSADALAYYTGSYTYDSLVDMTSANLLTNLRNLMRNTQKYTSTYDNCRDWAKYTDCENGDGRVSLIYTGYSATMSQWNGWNREHVWPKSLGGNNTSGGGADLHHIRPSDAVVNSTRGNKKYGEADGGKATYGNNPATGVLGGYSGTYFEPLDNVKGDVARICLYVYVRWGSAWGADSITEVFQSVDVLLEWCALDPVDTWEMSRNDVVEDIQGNRNVFIDYPELAWVLYGKEIPSDMTTPSGEAGNSGSGSGSTTPDVPVIPDPPACKHTNTEVKGYQAAGCLEDGYTGDTYCTDCGEKTADGSVIPSAGKHSFGDWVYSDDMGCYIKTCSKCGTFAVMNINDIVASVDSDAEKIMLLLSLGISDSVIYDALTREND